MKGSAHPCSTWKRVTNYISEIANMPFIVQEGYGRLTLGKITMICGILFFFWQLLWTIIDFNAKNVDHLYIAEPAVFMAVGLCLISGVIFENKYLVGIWIVGSMVSVLLNIREIICRIYGWNSCYRSSDIYSYAIITIVLISLLEGIFEAIALRYVLSYYLELSKRFTF